MGQTAHNGFLKSYIQPPFIDSNNIKYFFLFKFNFLNYRIEKLHELLKNFK